MCEATTAVADILRLRGQCVVEQEIWVHGSRESAPTGWVDSRDTHEHVVQCGEGKVPLLMAARKDTCTGFPLQKYYIWMDQHYKAKSKPKSRMGKAIAAPPVPKPNLPSQQQAGPDAAGGGMPAAASTATSQADYDRLKPQGAQGPISGS